MFFCMISFILHAVISEVNTVIYGKPNIYGEALPLLRPEYNHKYTFCLLLPVNIQTSLESNVVDGDTP